MLYSLEKMSDNMLMLVNQIFKDISFFNQQVTNLLALVGACYALRYSFTSFKQLGQGLLSIGSAFKAKSLIKNYGRWALITGPTSGVGKAFALNLAANGLNIVLVGRNEKQLNSLSKLLEVNHGVQTIIIMANLENFDDEMYKKFNNLSLEIDLGILINNAGLHYDYPQLFNQVDYKRVSDMCDVNVSSVAKMSHALLGGMMRRRRGLIVNMSSSAGILHSPMTSLYSSSKRFVDHFSQSLYHELKPHNIHVQSLTPMYINTKMTDYSSLLSSSAILCPSPERYVKSALLTLGNYPSNTGYFPHTLQAWIIQKLPTKLAVWGGHQFHRYLHNVGVKKFKKE